MQDSGLRFAGLQPNMRKLRAPLRWACFCCSATLRCVRLRRKEWPVWLPLGNGMIVLGGELAWPTPTRPGDTLHVGSQILEIEPSCSKPNQAIFKVRSTRVEPAWRGGTFFHFKVPGVQTFAADEVTSFALR